MIKIIDNKKDAAKYIRSMEDILKKYHSIGAFREELKVLFDDGEMIKLYENSPVKKSLFRRNIISGVKIPDLAVELGLSPSRLYELRREILKELVAVFFRVIIL